MGIKIGCSFFSIDDFADKLIGENPASRGSRWDSIKRKYTSDFFTNKFYTKKYFNTSFQDQLKKPKF